MDGQNAPDVGPKQLRKARLVESNPTVMMGKPVIVGTRITVELILDKLAASESGEQILESHPCLTRGPVRQPSNSPSRSSGRGIPHPRTAPARPRLRDEEDVQCREDREPEPQERP